MITLSTGAILINGEVMELDGEMTELDGLVESGGAISAPADWIPRPPHLMSTVAGWRRWRRLGAILRGMPSQPWLVSSSCRFIRLG